MIQSGYDAFLLFHQIDYSQLSQSGISSFLLFLLFADIHMIVTGLSTYID